MSTLILSTIAFLLFVALLEIVLHVLESTVRVLNYILISSLLAAVLYVIFMGNLSSIWLPVFLGGLVFAVAQELIIYLGTLDDRMSLLAFIAVACSFLAGLWFFFLTNGPIGWEAGVAFYMLCGVWYVIRDLRKPGFLGHFGVIDRQLLGKKNEIAWIWPICLQYDAANAPFSSYSRSWRSRERGET